MIRLRRLFVVAVLLLTPMTIIATETPAVADSGNCITTEGYVECGFVKTGYRYAVNSVTRGQGSTWICGQARFTNYDGAGNFVSRVTKPTVCGYVARATSYPDVYTKQRTRRVCFNWILSRPTSGATRAVCVGAPF
jgi:hypothetical protein